MTNEDLRIEKVMDHNDEAKAKKIISKLMQEDIFREFFYDSNTKRIYSRPREKHEIRYEKERSGGKSVVITEYIHDYIVTGQVMDYIISRVIAFMLSREPCSIYINGVPVFTREVTKKAK